MLQQISLTPGQTLSPSGTTEPPWTHGPLPAVLPMSWKCPAQATWGTLPYIQ